MYLKKNLLLFFVLSVLFYSCGKKGGDTPPPPPPSTPGCTTNAGPASGSFVTTNSVSLSWNSASGATGYDVYVGTSVAGATVVAPNVSGTSYNFSIPATATSVTYYWYVVPKNTAGTASSCSSAASSFTFAVIAAPAPFGYYVVGYLPSYRNVASIPDVKFRMTNVVVYAFYGVNSSGTITAPASPSSTLAAVRDKARANNSKIFLGINDGVAGNFKSMAATAAGRTNSDGTDVTFTALMKELSDSLHRDSRYYLSTAITAGKYAGGYRDAIKNEIFPYVDFFNIMAYDDFNTSVPYRQHSDYTLASVCLNYWLVTRGMPASKCVLGVPCYGRPSGITQSGTVLTYSGILSQGGSPLSDSAIVTAGSFTNYTIYYNGQYTTKRKAKLAKDVANGIMFWEAGQDVHDNNSLFKAACDTIGRSY